MRINGVKCEQCGTIHHISDNLSDRYVQSKDMPDGWLVLLLLKKSEREDPLHLCSLWCLKLWVARQFIPEGPPAPMGPAGNA